MTRLIVALAALSPSMALAHAGDHGAFTFDQTLAHSLTQSDHIAMAVAALAIPVAMFTYARFRK